MTTMTTTTGLAALAMVLMIGCAGADDASAIDGEPVADESAEALSKGHVTWERPEVGQLAVAIKGGSEFCTGTLVAPQTILTAAHCVDFKTKLPKPGQNLGYFDIRTRDASGTLHRHHYVVDGHRNFGKPISASGKEIETDLALVHITTAVDAAVTKPVGIASTRPADGTSVALFGFGNTKCTATKDGIDDGRKRKDVFPVGKNPRALCPGDSGGPVFAHGDVFAVASSTDTRGFDYFAHAYNHVGELSKYLDDWR